MKRCFALFLLVWLAGCSAEGTLIVQVRTDLTPGEGFDSVTVDATGEGVARDAERLAGDATNWGAGVRVAELSGLPAGSYRLEVAALDDVTGVVVSRPVRVELESGTRVVTVLLTRDCASVVCPDAGDASAIACLGGRCVPEGCTEETPELCSMPECTDDGECGASSECTVAECSDSGTCFQTLDPMLCAAGQFCSADRGCFTTGACSEWNVRVNAEGMAGPSAGQDVAITSESALVVWSQSGAGIHVSPRDPETGTALGASTELASSGAQTHIVAGAAGGAFATWASGRTLYATNVDELGMGGAPFTLTGVRGTTDGWVTTPVTAQTLVSWIDTSATPTLRHGFAEGGVVSVTDTTLVEARSISHVDVGGGVILACYEIVVGQLRCDQITATSGTTSEGPVFSTMGSAMSPSATLGPSGEVGVAFVDGGQVRLARTDASGAFDATRSSVVIADVSDAGPPSLAYDGTHYAAAYTRSGALEVVTWLAPDGTTDLHRFPAAGMLTATPRIVAGAAGFYVVYRAESGSPAVQDVYLLRVCP